MIIDIVGGGSLGLLYGSRMVLSGQSIRLWCRSMKQVELLRSQGLYISEEGAVTVKLEPHQFEANIIENFSEIWCQRPGDWLLLMTKQKDVLNVCRNYIEGIRSYLHLYHPPGVICFQNGTGHVESIQDILQGWDVYTAITTEGAKRISGYEIFHAGRGDTWIGISGKSNLFITELKRLEIRADSLINGLQQAGFKALLSNDIDEIMYRKLLMNAVINPLTSLWRVTNGQLLDSSQRMG
ncbi:2-dehydropantoate 2-reductase [Paenibacillus pini JCM 16418]|uniref:2-dehydropantoate 2-reductase n=1 Tax=Paenibacillus pini JCM 16418 TaxID=1236976 RepID=W7Y838_9BACL|nr:2-dehydropantoate 2-reductase N-terminal domain-containing protein [Paenibacillus pini]GAF07070.1 2-dehydropantoate 2-reductase [Paenibacillus pini JCM 16418]